MNVGNDRERADITDSAKDRQSASVHTPKSTLVRRQDHPGAESHATQSPLHDSPKTVEHALGVPFVLSQISRTRSSASATMGHGQLLHYAVTRERWLIDFLKPTFRFKVLEFVRSHLGIWAHARNVVLLLLGCLFSTTWIRRLQNVSIVQTIDAGNLWTCIGRTTSIPCWFVMAEEVNDIGSVAKIKQNGRQLHLVSYLQLSDDMITRSKEWRVAGLISHRTFPIGQVHVNKVCRINLSSGAKAVFRNMGPHFTTGTYKTSMSAVGVWVDSNEVPMTFGYVGCTSHTMSVNIL